MLLGSAFALTAGSLTSLISELLQSGLFTAGRAPSFSDVMLNIYGFILGVAIYLLARFIIKKIIQKKALIPN
jgi:VanZ family protein